MSGIEFQVAHEVPAAPPAARITAHVAPTPVSCEDSDTATAGQTAVPKPRHVRFDSLVESQSSPQGVSLLDRSLNPSAHVFMLPRHILDSIQLDDALGEEDHSPAGTGRPKRKGPPRIKSRRSRSSKQRLPASLHSPLLPDVVPAAAHSSSGYQTCLSHSQSYSCDTAAAISTPLHRLKSGLAAGWQQLCKAGRRVMAAGQKLCKKLLSALGGMRAEEQAESLLAEHQAAEIAALAVQPKGSWGTRLFQARPRAGCCAGACRDPSLCPWASQKCHAQTHAAFEASALEFTSDWFRFF